MYLKSIQTQGFKSFADKIDLELGRGITTIVGPNGSGKSNVSDAVRWALGEQSAKTLRGGNMQDVIFAGTQKRKPLGFAQVTLTIDNSDRAFNIDSDEVKILRRVHRSGESEYAINGNSCRLKDVHELFMDTGLGRDGYSIIGQGKIDEILSSKSEDRRAIFEEAAGISRYKYRKLEAEKKLNQTEENLIRIKDIIVQLEEQVGPLESQAKKARIYLDLREKLKDLDINIALYNIEKHRTSLKSGEQDYKDVFAQLNSEREKLKDIDKKIETDDETLTKLLSEINNLRQTMFDMEKSSGGLHGRVEILKNNIENNNANSGRIQSEIKFLYDKIDGIDSENKAQCEILSKKNNIKSEIETRLADLNRESDEIYSEIDIANEKIDSLKADIIEYLNDASSLRAQVSSYSVIINNFNERKDTIASDIDQKKETILRLNQDIDKLNADVEKNSVEKEKFLADLENLKIEYFKITKELDEIKSEQNKRTTEFNEKQSKYKALSDLERGYEGYYKSVKSVLKLSLGGVHGVVSKLIDVDDKIVTAIEIALGGAIQNIVVDNEETAKEAVEYLKKNSLGRATFLPISSVKGYESENMPVGEIGYLGIASSLIKYDSKYDGIFKHLLGRVAVVDNIDNAIKIARKFKYKFKIVTLSGDVLSAGGAVSGGSINQNQKLLSRAKDIEALRLDLISLQKEIDKCDTLIQKYKNNINKIAEKKQGLDDGVQRCENESVRLELEIKTASAMLDDVSRSYDALTNENGGIAKEISDIEKSVAKFERDIAEGDYLIKKTREMLTDKESQNAVKIKKAEDISAQIVDEKLAYNNVIRDIESACSSLDSLKLNKSALIDEIAQKQENIKNVEEENNRINIEIIEITKSAQNNKSETDAIAKKIESQQKMYDDGVISLKTLQKSSKEMTETIYVLSQEVSRLESKNSKAALEMEMFIDKLWDEYELTYSACLEYKKDNIVISSAAKEAASIRSQIKGLGNINIDAIDEYKAVKEKYEFLSAQKNDLDESKAKLEGIIKEIQTVMITQFKESFEIIKEKFNRIFSELFGGGSGKLTLTEPNDVLESGIEIEVQPPGKKLKNLVALSGGERAFTAIALLFAVLEVRVTPFCILDEVEAPLDDVNVYRFANYVKKYSSDTQFIIVTHKRGTMEAADIMYGVTMQEKGVSKILKLKFDDLEDYDVK